MNKTILKSIKVLSLLLVFVFAGCGDTTENSNNTTVDPPSPTDPTATCPTIFLNGRCSGGVTSISCEDRSTTAPEDQVQVVGMVVRNANGDTVATDDLPGGCATAPQLPCNIGFRGLAPGDYEVDHSVTTKVAGCSIARFTYREIEVTGPNG